MRIGAVATIAAVSTRAVRHYHHVGLLPEPRRTQNGYRDYQLGDVVRLLRIRRLVELGLSLDEVADAIADDSGRDLAEILAELDASLAAQQASLQQQRDRIAEIAAAAGNVDSAQFAAFAAEMKAILGPDHPSLPRELNAFHVLQAMASPTELDQMATVATVLGAEGELRERYAALSGRFEELAGCSPTDSAVDDLAAAAAELIAELGGLLVVPAEQESVAQASREQGLAAGGRAEDLFLAAVGSELNQAQLRCLSLINANLDGRL